MLVQTGDEKGSGVSNSSLLAPVRRLLRREGPAAYNYEWQDWVSQAVESKY